MPLLVGGVCGFFNYASYNSVILCFQPEGWVLQCSFLTISSCSLLFPHSALGFLSCVDRAVSGAALAHRNYFNPLNE